MALPKRLGFILALALTGALATAGSAAAQTAEIDSKRAEAQGVLEQIEVIDMQLDRAIDVYNGATLRLEEIQDDLAQNTRYLRLARKNLQSAEARMEARIVQLYTQGEPNTVEVILGATSFEDLLERLDTAGRVASEDVAIAGEVRHYKAEVARRQKQLENARAEQKEVVAKRAAQREAIEDQLAEREALYASIQDEIQRLEAEERERQARLAAQARARAAAAARAQAEQEAQEAAAQEAPAEQESSSGGSSSSPPPAPPPAPSPPAAPPPPPAPTSGGVVGIALSFLGIPYVWGGASPSGFDCSGFTMYVYSQVGVSLPHHAASQYGYGSPVSRSSLAPGDLVFFNGLSHVGIYIGGGQFVHSPHTGDVVKISSISGWYSSTWVGAKRL
jgi:peptidoglycan DL-endopeptidase CwlO